MFATRLARMRCKIFHILGFIDGKVFFVYGSDLERVTAVGGEISMERLRQTKDRFQRILVDSDLDGNDGLIGAPLLNV